MNPISIFAIIGSILSFYALYVKWKAHDKKYKPLCDFKENISCTKAFTSRYGKLAVLPNPLYGLFFYTLLFFLIDYAFYFGLIALPITIYLAYVSYVKQKNFCLICNGIYLINILILIFSYL